MTDEKSLHSALTIFLKKIGGRKIRWHLEGSLNLLVQGVDVNHKDIDITTDRKGMLSFSEALKGLIYKEHRIEESGAHLIHAKINDVEIEIAHYDDPNKNQLDRVQTTSWKGLKLNTISLLDAKRFYTIINRIEKIKLIEDYITSSSLQQEK